MMAPDFPLRRSMDRLWNEAQAALLPVKSKTDPYLSDRDSDPRRGMTLIIRRRQRLIAADRGVIDHCARSPPANTL